MAPTSCSSEGPIWMDVMETNLSEHCEEIEAALDSMTRHFAYSTDSGQWHTGGLSALEYAFEALGWDDPCDIPEELLCADRLCQRLANCGTPTSDGYRRTCSEHIP